VIIWSWSSAKLRNQQLVFWSIADPPIRLLT
jgi:hypothetical protein